MDRVHDEWEGEGANIPPGADPLGFGIRSIPEPMQRLWLIYQGNPYFDEDVRAARNVLDLPTGGFSDRDSYVGWRLKDRLISHGHPDEFFKMATDWPPEWLPPPPCCAADPLHRESVGLSERYGIADAAFEPGFEGIEKDVAAYILVKLWPHQIDPTTARRSFRGFSWEHEEDIVVNPHTGQRGREIIRYTRTGQEAKRGAGRHLWLHYEWWRRRQAGESIPDIANATIGIVGSKGVEDRTIRSGIERVESLMHPPGGKT